MPRDVDRMKILLKYILFFSLAFFSAQASFASSGTIESLAGEIFDTSATGIGPGQPGLAGCVTMPNQLVSPQDIAAAVDACIPGSVDVHDTTYFRLCELRRFFCGKVKLVLIAAAITIMGFLIVTAKAKWTHAVTLVVGIVIFSSAEWITIHLTTFPPNIGVVYSCFCIEEFSDVVSNFTRLFTF